MKFYALLVGFALASSKPRKNSAARKAELHQRRLDAGGDCNNVVLKCNQLDGCSCHGVYKTDAKGNQVVAKCILKDDEKLQQEGNTQAKISGSTNMCRGAMPPCKKRQPVGILGQCDQFPSYDQQKCVVDCAGSSCMPNFNGKKCQQRKDVCKAFKNRTAKCDKYKRYTLSAYAPETCCRKCYRKDAEVPCLYGYMTKNAGKKQGSQEVATWDPEFRSMKDSKTKLCCRIKKDGLQALKDSNGDFSNPVWGPTPDGRVELLMCKDNHQTNNVSYWLNCMRNDSYDAAKKNQCCHTVFPEHEIQMAVQMGWFTEDQWKNQGKCEQIAAGAKCQPTPQNQLPGDAW